jgi:hypothetical protein
MVGTPEQPGRKDARVTIRRHLIFLLGAAVAALSLCVAPKPADAASKVSKPRELTPHQQAVMRRQLRKALRRNPQKVLRRDFLKTAQAVDLNLPLTLRLRRDDQGPRSRVGVAWTSDTFPWPVGFAELQPATGDPDPGGAIPLDGTSSLEAEFGNDVSGYAGPGVVETLTGGRVVFDSGTITPAIAVSDYAQSQTDNVPLCHVPTIQLSQVSLRTGRTTQSLLHLFGGTARVTLRVLVGTTTELAPTNCSGPITPDGHQHDATGADPIVPVSFDATFKIAPSVTSDGKLRLGLLSLPAASVQPTTFARITMCVAQGSPCATRAFPARLQMLALDAEVLVGDVFA